MRAHSGPEPEIGFATDFREGYYGLSLMAEDEVGRQNNDVESQQNQNELMHQEKDVILHNSEVPDEENVGIGSGSMQGGKDGQGSKEEVSTCKRRRQAKLKTRRDKNLIEKSGLKLRVGEWLNKGQNTAMWMSESDFGKKAVVEIRMIEEKLPFMNVEEIETEIKN